MARKPTPADLDPEAGLVAKIDEVRAGRAKAERSNNAWTAVSTLHALEAKLLAELRGLRSTTRTQPVEVASDLSDEELVDGLIASILAVPDEALDRIEDAIALRRSGKPVLKVVSGDDE